MYLDRIWKQDGNTQDRADRVCFNLNLRFRWTEMMTNAFPSTAPMIIVPKMRLLMHIMVNSTHRSSATAAVVVGDVTNDESFASLEDDE